MKKQGLSILLAISMLTGMTTTSLAAPRAAAVTPDNRGAVMEPYVAPDPENDRENALREAQLAKAPRANATSYSVTVPQIKQITAWYCGPASADMVLKSLGKTVGVGTASLWYAYDCYNDNCWGSWSPHVCRQTYTNRQVNLAKQMKLTDTTGSLGASMLELKNTVNTSAGSSYYTAAKSTTTSSLESHCEATLGANRPVVLLLNPNKLQAYISRGCDKYFTGGHYVVAKGLNKTSKTVTIGDCNYYDKMFITYTETYSNAISAMNASTRTYNIVW